MQLQVLNLIIGLIGLVILLTGLICQSTGNDLAAMALTGVGASVLATAIVNGVLNQRPDNVLINSILDSISEGTKFVRMDHELEITCSPINEEILIQKIHTYCLYNSGYFNRKATVAMFTDSNNWVSRREGSFISIIEPSGVKLEHESLYKQVYFEDGKMWFKKTYDLNPGKSRPFEFNSRGLYRKRDRLVWTVQHLSMNFKVRIVNRTGSHNCFTVKINHHKEREINESIQIRHLEDGSEIIFFEFLSEILPYQGFELMWNIK